MKHYYLITNPAKKDSERISGLIAGYLNMHGASCIVGPLGKKSPDGVYRYTDASKVPQETECVITLGGDGTMIQAARDLVNRQLPMIGVNLGTLGYLTQISGEDGLIPMLDALLEDKYTLENRMMLNGMTIDCAGRNVSEIALNEIVVTRKDVLRVLKFRVYVNGECLNDYTADGVIVATPTGSTAYNLSAGGPVVEPAAQMMILTPICSHSLNARSIVLSPESDIRIQMLGEPGQEQTAVFDGDARLELAAGDSIEIRRSGRVTKMIKLSNVSFLDNLRNKMSRV